VPYVGWHVLLEHRFIFNFCPIFIRGHDIDQKTTGLGHEMT